MKYSSILKKYIALALIAILVTTSSVFAEDVPNKEQVSGGISQQAATELVNSGDNVRADAKADEQHDQTIENANQAAVQQATTVNANTGNNEASRNISIGGNAGVIQTGSVGVETQAVAAGNSNTTAVSGGSSPTPGVSGGGASTSAVNTGDNVSASSSSSNSSNTGVSNTNDATVNQSTLVNANTGNNRADRNISIGGAAGVINTGSVGVSTYYLAVPNHNATLVGGSNSSGTGPGSGASIQLANTGNGVSAASNSSNSTNTSVSNSNSAFINQLTQVNANTGNNTANRNIAFGGDAGVIYTGNIGVGVTYVVDGNGNATAVAGGGGNGSAGNGSTNDVANTGNNVNTSADSSNEANTSVSNSNKTYITQTAYVNANTGNNIANRNIGYGGTAGGIATGSVGVSINFLADFSRDTTIINPTATYYLPYAVGEVATTPTPTAAPVEGPYSTEEPVYYYYPDYRGNPVIYSPYANYVSEYSAINTSGDNGRAQVAVQQSNPQSMSAGGLSQLLIMLVSLGALGLRKIVRV